MSTEKVRALLDQLRLEMQSTNVNPDSLSLLEKLDASLAGRTGHPDPATSLADRVKELEVRFATRHERTETLLRQIIDMLGKIGM
mgnify:CR=1 FL=1